MLIAYREDFPRWKTQPGALSSGDLVNLLGAEKVHFTRFVCSRDWNDISGAVKRYGGDNVVGTFVLRRLPVGHGYLVLGFGSPPTSDKVLQVMDPDRQNPGIFQHEADTLFQQSDCDYLVFFQ